MRFYLHKAYAVAFLVFIGLWLIGSIRGMTLPFPPPLPMSISSGPERDYFSSRAPSNWANNLKQIDLVTTPLPLLLDKADVDKIRIFEKTAALTTGTTAFADDETLIRAAIKDYQASVFNEKSSGIAPGRQVMIEIGVNPDQFDALVDRLKKVGSLATITVEQKDRTSEFRKLLAQRQTLKKSLDGIVKLREGKTLTFDESLRLEQKIQDIEKELQSLGVQFGDLLGKESFYHVHLTLIEHQQGDRRDHTYTVPQRIGHAFVWAIVWWFGVAGCVLLMAATGVSVWVLRQKPPA